MFNNRAVQMSFVKTPKPNTSPADIPVNSYPDPEVINTIAQDFVRSTTITIVAAVGSYKILSTICDIAKIAAKAKF